MEQSNKQINAIRYISHLAHKALPSSECLKYSSKFYNQEKVNLYELCMSIINVCNQGGNK